MDSPLGLSLIDPGTLPPIVTSPTYTDVFNSTMGNAATDADGVPLAIADLADRARAFEADVAAGDGELADAVSAGASHDTSVADALAASLPGVTSAGDILLGAATGLIAGPTPPPAGGGTGGGTGGGAPTPPNVTPIGPLTVGRQPFLMLVDLEITFPQTTPPLDIVIASGDTQIFSVSIVSTFHEGPRGTGNTQQFRYYLTVTPVKAGTFDATIDFLDHGTKNLHMERKFQATITA